jgi:3-hydroxyacyl-CoA dehydrogenase/enoyl-CoA hydratase/3-hydroxybutyryl-CoA epimerase/enoyl-CoA isomerase
MLVRERPPRLGFVFEGKSIQVRPLGEGFVELCFDRQGEAINKFDRRTVAELSEAVAAIAAHPAARGLLITSAKQVFIVGADITEFGQTFRMPPAKLAADTFRSNVPVMALEDLPVPSVTAINGYALGAGLELALATAYRVMSTSAEIGLPEVKLGLFPGLGGTVRLPRVAGAATAVDWIASGKSQRAAEALAARVVEEVCEPERLRDSALALLRRAADGRMDWRGAQERKRRPLAVTAAALREAIEPARRRAADRSAKSHEPAALAAVELIERAAMLPRDEAQRAESDAFSHIAHTQAAGSLVQAFVNDQAVKKLARRYGTPTRRVASVGVLAAGAAGTDVASAFAARGIGVHSSGTAEFEKVDLVVSTIDDDLAAARRSLSKVEGSVSDETVIASTASKLPLDDVATALRRPENLVGMHFPDPVLETKLVEVVRGSRSSDAAVATALSCAASLGKTPIVVRNSSGGVVHRVRAAFIRAAEMLLADGAEVAHVKRALETFGWSKGIEDIEPLRADRTHPSREYAHAEIVERTMLPVIIESARALEQGVVGTPAELDTAITLGLGLPAYVGGPLRYADWLGLDALVRRAEAYSALGLAYSPTPGMRAMAKSGARYYAS